MTMKRTRIIFFPCFSISESNWTSLCTKCYISCNSSPKWVDLAELCLRQRGGLILLLILTNPDFQGHGQNLVNIKLCISDSLNLSVSCGIVDLLKHFIWTGKGNWSTGPTGETTCNSKTPKILQHLGTFITLIFNTWEHFICNIGISSVIYHKT